MEGDCFEAPPNLEELGIWVMASGLRHSERCFHRLISKGILWELEAAKIGPVDKGWTLIGLRQTPCSS